MTGHTRSLRVLLLSGPQVFWGDEAMQMRTRKGLALMCFLARKVEPVSRSRLATLLWPESEVGLKNLRWELHQLRKLPGSDEWLLTDAASVQVIATTDIHELELAVAQEDYAKVLRLTPDNPGSVMNLPGLPAIQEWLSEERDLLTAWRQSALRNEALRLEAASQLSEARHFIHEALKSDPLDEENHRTAMRLALRQGDLTAAQAQFETCRRMLASELGLEPTAATLALAIAIESARSASPAFSASSSLPAPLLHPPRLIGRHREWAQLQQAWDRNQLIFISGPPGSGKTRLAQEFIRTQVDTDAVTVLRGFASDVDTPFSTYARGWRIALERQPELLKRLPDWVQDEAAQHLSGLLSATLSDTNSGGTHLQQVRALNELYRHHLQGYAAALVDDIHHFDEHSWRLGRTALQELIEDDAELNCRIVITFRDDGLLQVMVPHLRSLLARGRAVHIQLSELTEDEVDELLRSIDRPDIEAIRLMELAGGTPFGILETVRLLHANPDLSLRMPASELLPASILELNRLRLARVSPVARRIAQTMAQERTPRDAGQLGRLAGIRTTAASLAVAELQEQGLVTDFVLANELVRATLLLDKPAALQTNGYASANAFPTPSK